MKMIFFSAVDRQSHIYPSMLLKCEIALPSFVRDHKITTVNRAVERWRDETRH